jgi:hypothetical protein
MAITGVRAALVGVGCLALVAAVIVGISDNLPGLALLYGAVVCLIVAVAWRWRRPRSFFLLFALSGAGFFIFAVLHNLFYAIGKASTAAWIHVVTEGLHVVSFLVAVLICPPGILVGLVGWLIVGLRSRGGSRPENG